MFSQSEVNMLGRRLFNSLLCGLPFVGVAKAQVETAGPYTKKLATLTKEAIRRMDASKNWAHFYKLGNDKTHTLLVSSKEYGEQLLQELKCMPYPILYKREGTPNIYDNLLNPYKVEETVTHEG